MSESYTPLREFMKSEFDSLREQIQSLRKLVEESHQALIVPSTPVPSTTITTTPVKATVPPAVAIPASIAPVAPATDKKTELPDVFTKEIKSKSGQVLAIVNAIPNQVIIDVKPDVAIPIKSPIDSFLLNKIFKAYAEKDKKDNLPEDKRFHCVVNKTPTGTIGRIVITNFKTKEVLAELLSTTRWAFERVLNP